MEGGSSMAAGEIPVGLCTGKGLAEAFESALVTLYEGGIRMRTQYDKPGDPPSIDCSMNITVSDPLSEPMIHKAFPGGVADLREYVMELEGAKDDWVKAVDDPNDTRWEYTYHGRFARHGHVKRLARTSMDGMTGCSSTIVDASGDEVDQISAVVDKLAKSPFTRQAQMITWMPSVDLGCYDPPCLQSIWCRIVEADAKWWLNWNIRFRSNDAWGAAFMNMFGLTMMMNDLVVRPLAAATGKDVVLGRLNWQADSFHVYGKDIEALEKGLIERRKRPPLGREGFLDRTMRFDDPDVRAMYDEATAVVEAKLRSVSEGWGAK